MVNLYYQEELEQIKKCSKLQIRLTDGEKKRYRDLFEQNPYAFRKNVTKQFYDEMNEHINNGKVWRINESGVVRHGKSEVAQTHTMLHIDMFNLAIENGKFDHLKEQGINYKLKKLDRLTQDKIMVSQAHYMYTLRELQRKEQIVFGESRIVDEDEESTGGTGSYSERLEIENMNNITAQAIQNEWQLRPNKFVLENAPFGLHQEKMDRENKINWSMLYQAQTYPTATAKYFFIGWVATPLHFDDELRKKYNARKQENIIKVLKGEGDLRLNERLKVARELSEDELFSLRTQTGFSFKLSKQQQESILNEWITEGIIQNFNSQEKYEIVEHARLIVERRLLKEQQEKVAK